MRSNYTFILEPLASLNEVKSYFIRRTKVALECYQTLLYHMLRAWRSVFPIDAACCSVAL